MTVIQQIIEVVKNFLTRYQPEFQPIFSPFQKYDKDLCHVFV
jgi:hypothetical protein